MIASGEIDKSPSRRTIVLLVLSAALVGLLILFGAVLPAEYGRDPTGLGRLTGIDKLWAPKVVTVPPVIGRAPAQRSEHSTPFRTDVVRIPLAAAGDPEQRNMVEYKVRMKKGSTLVYSWSVPDLPEAARNNFYTQLHGHTLEDEQTMTVVEYRVSLKDSDAGVLTAAIDGIDGWFAENRSDKPVTMVVKLAGFYTLIPPGETGNEAGILAEGVSQSD